jgi:hypothetical protein
LFFENSTAALILVKRKSSVGSLRIAAVVLGGLAPTSPHDDANKTGSVERGGGKHQMFQQKKNYFISFHFAKQGAKKKLRERREREERKRKERKERWGDGD